MFHVLRLFFKEFFKQYPFGVLLIKEMYDDSISLKHQQDVKNTLKHFGFESIDKNGLFKYLEYESRECCFEQEEKYYDKNMVLWNWFRNDCTQSVIRNCNE